VALYLLGIATSFVSSWISGAAYVIVALLWLIPEQRIERALAQKNYQRWSPLPNLPELRNDF